MGTSRDVEDIYALSPQQLGMLMEILQEPGAGMHVEQGVWLLRGEVSAAWFEEAWRRIVQRHPAMRTCFVWEGIDEPLQVVVRSATIPIALDDWSRLEPSEQRERLDSYLGTDRATGFNPAAVPLMRFGLFRTSADTHWMVWTFHHILMDGWCLPLIIDELVALIEALRDGRELELSRSRPYGDYIDWLKGRDAAGPEEYWRRILRGMTRPTALGRRSDSQDSAEPSERYGCLRTRVDATATAGLQLLGRKQGVTPSTLLHGAWALLLSRYSGDGEVVFGSTVAGRPADLEGSERMIGLFINTLPLRASVDPEAPLIPWMRAIQVRHAESRDFEHCSAGQIHQWSEVPGALPLYESVLVFENYPSLPPPARSTAARLRAEMVRGEGARTRYPLVIMVVPASELEIAVVFDRRRIDSAAAKRVLGHLAVLIERIVADPEQKMSSYLAAIPDDEIPRIRQQRERPREKSVSEAPRTAVEKALAFIWQQLLGVGNIGRNESFFRLGGHSLTAIQLVGRMRNAFKVDVPMKDAFEATTIAELAKKIEKAREEREEMKHD